MKKFPLNGSEESDRPFSHWMESIIQHCSQIKDFPISKTKGFHIDNNNLRHLYRWNKIECWAAGCFAHEKDMPIHTHITLNLSIILLTLMDWRNLAMNFRRINRRQFLFYYSYQRQHNNRKENVNAQENKKKVKWSLPVTLTFTHILVTVSCIAGLKSK